MNHLKLAWKSALTRKTGVGLTMLSIGVAVVLLLGFDRIGKDMNSNFTGAVSQTDLVVGARTSPLNLLLFGVFQYGAATNNVSYETYQRIAAMPEVAWTIPISWGDSHKGFRIMGTDLNFFEHYRYAEGQKIHFKEGKPFGADVYDIVIGHEVAERLNYKIGQKIVAAHGLVSSGEEHDHDEHEEHSQEEHDHGKHEEHAHEEHDHGEHEEHAREEHDHGEHEEQAHKERDHEEHAHEGHEANEEEARSQGQNPDPEDMPSHPMHDDKPYYVTGILKKTGTVLDKNLFVSLKGMEALHLGWKSGAPSPIPIPADWAKKLDLQPENITLFLVGLKDRKNALSLVRELNDYEGEALTAILPAAALLSLWNLMSGLENALLIFSGLILNASLISMLIVLLSTLNERRREMAILKTLGAKARHVYGLFALEAGMIVLGGCLVGVGVLYALLYFGKDWIAGQYGLFLSTSFLDAYQILILAGAVSLGVIFSLIPATIAYRRSVKDGLAVKY